MFREKKKKVCDITVIIYLIHWGFIPSIVDVLLHALILLILQRSELDHLVDVLFEIIYLQLQSVAMEVLL